jgi:uncharacterized protein (DUF1499 family)
MTYAIGLILLPIVILVILAGYTRRRRQHDIGESLPVYRDQGPGVHSRADNLSNYIAPFDYCEMSLLLDCAESHGWQMLGRTETVLHFESLTPCFSFVDDVYFEFDSLSKQIYVCSHSRIGATDFGVNRRRVEGFRKLLKQRVSDRINDDSSN